MLRNNKPKTRGSTLIEVLVVTLILGLSLTAMVGLITVSMARNRLAKERAVAVRLAQEGVEWVRAERDRLGFDGLVGLSQAVYCLSNFPPSTSVGGGIQTVSIDNENCGNVTGVTPNYVRKMRVVEADASHIEFVIEVSWPGSPNDNQVVLSGEVRQWKI